MFHRPDLGIILAGSHYISSLATGFLMRFYKGKEKKKPMPKNISKDKTIHEGNIFKKALNELLTARKNDGRSLGKLIGDSVRESINTLLMIGGFIILFSVITKILSVIGFVRVLTGSLTYLLEPFNLSSEMVLPLISGVFEITNGTNLASQAAAPLPEQLIVCSIIIAWSGLSVHGQVATMINGTDISLKPYLIARIFHGLLAGIITFLFLTPAQTLTRPVLQQEFSSYKSANLITVMISLSLLFIFLILMVSMFIYLYKKVEITFFKV
ncbi:MAG: hypothetical protein ACOC4G_14615 [Bacillota bacterium]